MRHNRLRAILLLSLAAAPAGKLDDWYEDYSADNRAYDNLLLPGENTQDYPNHAIAAAVTYRFRGQPPATKRPHSAAFTIPASRLLDVAALALLLEGAGGFASGRVYSSQPVQRV
jgi:hypothetical protein